MREAISISPNRILVIKLRKLGDVLSTTPALRQIRELYPEAEITFLTEPLGSKVYEHSSVVNHLLILSRKPSASEYIGMCFKIFRIRFDLVIDLYFHSKTALFTLMSGSKYRFGFSKTGKPTWAYNYTAQLTEHDRTKVYCTNHQLKLIEPLGIDYTDNKVDWDNGYAYTQFLMKKFAESGRAIHMTVATPEYYKSEFEEEDLILTGLTFKYDPSHKTSSIASLIKNFESVYKLEYVEQRYFSNIWDNKAKNMAKTYLTGLIKLYVHYQQTGNTEKEAWAKHLIQIIEPNPITLGIYNTKTLNNCALYKALIKLNSLFSVL